MCVLCIKQFKLCIVFKNYINFAANRLNPALLLIEDQRFKYNIIILLVTQTAKDVVLRNYSHQSHVCGWLRGGCRCNVFVRYQIMSFPCLISIAFNLNSSAHSIQYPQEKSRMSTRSEHHLVSTMILKEASSVHSTIAIMTMSHADMPVNEIIRLVGAPHNSQRHS